MVEDMVLPDYGGRCVSSLVPALMRGGSDEAPAWLPEPARDAAQVVLLVLDGLGWEQLASRSHVAPVLSAGSGGAITTVAPSTTAAALTSIATGLCPGAHGVVGYRMRVPGYAAAGGYGVMNVLRWQVDGRDVRSELKPEEIQPAPTFMGRAVPVVTRADFATTGFTAAHLGGARIVGWRVPTTMLVEVARLLSAGEPFVYAYYDGIDKVAHEHGLSEHYEAELAYVDYLIGELVDLLPAGAVLVVVSDHGQLEVSSSPLVLDREVMRSVELISGEGRFRWLHVHPGAEDDVLAAARELYGGQAWVMSCEEVEQSGMFGGRLSGAHRDRVGDVALVARDDVSFMDPADTGESLLVGRHGSLTPAEMRVPLLAFAGGS